MAEVEHDVVVVGGGIAGIGAAWALRDRRILLLERDQRLGGRLLSYPRGDVWLNLGAHLVPAGDSHMQSLIRDLGLQTLAVPGVKTALCFRDRVYAPRRPELYPLRLPLRPRDRLAMAAVGLKLMRSVHDWQRASVPSLAEADTDWRLRLGEYESRRSFADLLGNMPASVAAIFTTAARRSAADASEQAASVGISLFGALWVGRGSGGQVNVLGGSSRLPEAVAAQLGPAIELGAEVQAVEERGDYAAVSYRTASGERLARARRVIVATPADVARAVVRALPGDIDRALASVSYGPFVCMAVATSPAARRPWDDIYAMTTPGMAFNMLFNHANPVATVVRTSGTGSLMCYAGGSHAQQLVDVTDAEIRRRFLTDLRRIYPELVGAVTETVVQKWRIGNAYRTPATSLAPLLHHERRRGNLVRFAGDYFAPHGGMMEEAIQSGVRAAAAIHAELENGWR